MAQEASRPPTAGPGSIPGHSMVHLLWTKLHWEVFLLRVVQFVAVYVIPPLLLTHLHLHVAPTGRTNRRNLETFEKATLFGNRGALNSEKLVRFLEVII